MTVNEIKNEIMFQTSNDVEDLEDFLPYLMDYINEGYDKMVFAWEKKHVIPGGEYPPLLEDTDTPLLPDWTHRGLADYGTWLVYRNGNPQKQNRGLPFLNAFNELMTRILSEGGKNGPIRNFFNIPR